MNPPSERPSSFGVCHMVKAKQIFLVAVSLIFSSCQASDRNQYTAWNSIYQTIPSQQIDISFPEPLEVSEIEEIATGIVQCQITGGKAAQHVSIDAGSFTIYGERVDGWGAETGFTVSEYKVVEAYEGNFSKGDVIKIAEPFYIGQVSGQSTLIYYEGYLPPLKNNNIIFYLYDCTELVESEQELYAPVSLEYGRYVLSDVPAEKIQPLDLYYGGDNFDSYFSLYNQVAIQLGF